MITENMESIEQLESFSDIVEYVEKVSGFKLLEYQKEMLRLYANLPEGSCIVMGRKGPILLDKDGKHITNLKQTYILK